MWHVHQRGLMVFVGVSWQRLCHDVCVHVHTFSPLHGKYSVVHEFFEEVACNPEVTRQLVVTFTNTCCDGRLVVLKHDCRLGEVEA